MSICAGYGLSTSHDGCLRPPHSIAEAVFLSTRSSSTPRPGRIVEDIAIDLAERKLAMRKLQFGLLPSYCRGPVRRSDDPLIVYWPGGAPQRHAALGRRSLLKM